jgi:superkiller protein 3
VGKRSREKRERRKELEIKEGEVTPQHSKLERIYFLIIEWGTYLILFTPLIFLRNYFFPYVTPKTIFFRIIVDIILIAYVLLVFSNRRYLPKFNALTISLTLFLIVLILTSFTGINFEKSFWSTFERMTGLLTFFHLYAFFIILTSVFRERKYWERFLTTSILVGILLSFYVFTSDEPTARGGGTIGNTSFMSAYLLFDIFFAISLFLVKNGGWRIFYGVTLAIMLATLFFNIEPTQGAIGAFWGGIFILVFGSLFFYLLSSEKKLFKRLAFLMVILIILGGIGLYQLSFVKEKIAGIRHSGSFQSRMIVWQIAWQGWQEKFWLGWGPENFNIVFVKNFNPKLALPEYGTDVWYDRVHNIVFDTAVTSGILGLLSYISIFVVAIFSLIRVLPKIVERKNIFLPLGMIALLAVYFAQNILVFDMISSYMVFFLSLAFIYFLIQGKSSEVIPEKEVEKKGSHSFLGALIIIITLFTIYFGNIQPARASQYIVRGISLPPEKAIRAFEKAIRISPMSIFEAPEQFSRRMSGLTFEKGQNREVLKEGFGLAAEEMKKAIAKSPQDFRLYLTLGRHYNDFYQITQDKEKLELAESYLEKAIELSPRNQQGYWTLAQTRLIQGKAAESITLMQKAVDLEPRFAQSHWYLAMTYRAVGDFKMAAEKVKDAEKAGYNWKATLGDLKKVIEIYQNLQDDEKLVELYSLAIQKDPQNAHFRAGLAVAYANLGQFEKARQSAKEAMDLNPDFAPELEEFLKQLPK